MKGETQRHHGELRGLEGVPLSPLFEGRFGRMFRTLPPARFRVDDLKALAQEEGGMVAAFEESPTPEDQDDDEENSGISAGYTYFGQFIDHDLTFDPVSSLDKENDPNALTDFRTPRFDLDCIYGRGPDDQPYLYDQTNGIKMLLGRPLTGNPNDQRAHDLPRNAQGRALIGDPRNDENVIVSQLQAAMIRFHNRIAEVMKASHVDFQEVQRLVRWHYQWAVLHDFLPTLIGPETFAAILPHIAKKTSIHQDPPNLRFYRWANKPFIPVEFSVAAYRFGHSMVRPIYRLNRNLPRLAIFSDDPNTSLTGFREYPANFGIEWNLFFAMDPPPNPKDAKTRVQPAYKIDSSIVNPLGHLPTSVGGTIPSLAERNLLRALRMGLPSGQAVAQRMGIPVIPDDKLRVGKATKADTAKNPRLIDISPRFTHNAPLWYYILAESQQAFVNNKTPIRLGPVGGRIVGEVFVGLMLGDHHSFLYQNPGWKPMPQFFKKGRFGIAELIAQALLA
jgi:hypothetical protein